MEHVNSSYKRQPLRKLEVSEKAPAAMTLVPRPNRLVFTFLRFWQINNTERHISDKNLRRIRKVGRKQWWRESNYHRRSLAETTVFRFKTIFGDWLQNCRLIINSKNRCSRARS
jgi:hypothetical protein